MDGEEFDAHPCSYFFRRHIGFTLEYEQRSVGGGTDGRDAVDINCPGLGSSRRGSKGVEVCVEC